MARPLERNNLNGPEESEPFPDGTGKLDIATVTAVTVWWTGRAVHEEAALSLPPPRAGRWLVHKLLDAYDTENFPRIQHSELLWPPHLGHLRDLKRVAREVLANVS